MGTLTPDASDEQAAILKSMLEKHTKRNPKTAVLRLASGDVLRKTLRSPTRRATSSPRSSKIKSSAWCPGRTTPRGTAFELLGENPSRPDHVDVEIVATRSEIVDGLLARAAKVGVEPAVADYATSVDADTSIELLSFLPDPTRRTAAIVNAGVVCFLATMRLDRWRGCVLLVDPQCRASGSPCRHRPRNRTRRRLDEARFRERPPARAARPAHSKEAGRASHHVPVGRLEPGLARYGFRHRDRIPRSRGQGGRKIRECHGAHHRARDSPQFEGVRFAAPTTREPEEKLETFAIVGRAQGNAIEDKP